MMANELPPEHIGNIAAGHSRDEENRKRTDRLAEDAATGAENAGSISTDALKPDNEILQNFDPYSFELTVTNPQLGRHYLWVTSNSTLISAYRSRGYTMVQGNDPECKEHKGQHKAAGSSLRGVGDVLLMWCTEENFHKWEAHERRKGEAMQGVEENWEEDVNGGPVGRSFGPLAHGRRTDPLLRRTVLKGPAGELAHINDDLKSGRNIGGNIQVRG